MREKKVENYYMNLNGFAYDPFVNGGTSYIRVANLFDPTSRALFCVVKDKCNFVSGSMSEEDLAQVNRDLPRNIHVILGGLH